MYLVYFLDFQLLPLSFRLNTPLHLLSIQHFGVQISWLIVIKMFKKITIPVRNTFWKPLDEGWKDWDFAVTSSWERVAVVEDWLNFGIFEKEQNRSQVKRAINQVLKLFWKWLFYYFLYLNYIYEILKND